MLSSKTWGLRWSERGQMGVWNEKTDLQNQSHLVRRVPKMPCSPGRAERLGAK